MANNPLLEEFATSHPGDLTRRLTDAFDRLILATDEEIATRLKEELEAILTEQINALDKN